ncbi:MAG: AAA family ATPase [Desulfurivibrionaceae bacterium]
MPPTQQKLLRLNVEQLKNLRDLELDFGTQSLTAVMGANCCGKTTVLHALACAYRPLTGDDVDYRFPMFFKPNSDSLWTGSDFTIHYKERIGAEERNDLTQQYTKQNDRWTPRYHTRPERFTRFVQIKESVPDLEALNLNSMIHYNRDEITDDISVLIRDTAGQILNKNYSNLHRVQYAYGARKSFAVTIEGQTYAGVSMSSGEQRVFKILEAVYSAPKYALLLIDEIDLFLHQDALTRLINKLTDHCDSRGKQLVFTSHFPPVAKLYEQVSVVTLHRAPGKTVVWKGYSHEAIRHITGQQGRPICIFVEDDVAEAIISQVASDLGIRKFVEFGHYGPASNAYTLGAGMLLSGVNLDNTLVVLDGDKEASKPERIAGVKRVLTGDQPVHDEQRMALRRKIRALMPPELLSPEQILNRMLHSVAVGDLPAAESALLEIAQAVVNVPERHRFVNQIIDHTGESRAVALSKMVTLASRSPEWARYIKVVRRWLINRATILNLPLAIQ